MFNEVNDLIASYDTIPKDTSILFCADPNMSKFCLAIDYYTSDQKLLKIVVTGDDSLGKRTVS